MNPHRVNIHAEANKIRNKMIDERVWAFCGNYIMSAVYVAVERCLAGRKSKSEYIARPILQRIEDKAKPNTLSEEEKQRQVDLFFAKEKARRVNWRRNHNKSKDGTGS